MIYGMSRYCEIGLILVVFFLSGLHPATAEEKPRFPISVNLAGMKTTIAIYNETKPPKPASLPEKYIDQSALSEALKELAEK